MDTYSAAIPLVVVADSAPEAEGRLHALTDEVHELLEAHPGVEIAEGYGALVALEHSLTNALVRVRGEIEAQAARQ